MLVLVALAIAAPSAGAQPAAAPARVIDRTFVCTVDLWAGLRKVKVSAHSGFRDAGEWKWPPSASLTWNNRRLASVGAGLYDDPRARALGVDPDKCKASKARVRLSARGLVGGPASQLQGSDAYECVVPGRVVVRIRAVFRRPVTLRVQRLFQNRVLTTTVAVPAREAQLAVRTQAGKALAFATTHESGRTRLFTSPTCVAD